MKFSLMFLIVATVLYFTVGMWLQGKIRDRDLEAGSKQKAQQIKEVIQFCNQQGGSLVVYDAMSKGLEFDCVKLIKVEELGGKYESS